MELVLQDIIAAIGGRCLNPPSSGHNLIKAIEIDSRKVTPNSLFVPLIGERFNGHDFIPSVAEQGALATLTEEMTIRDERIIHIFVADTQKALLDLAAYYRGLFEIPLIGITGSVGKTSTKDMIASVLSAKFEVLKTQGNFNNEIGLPLTLFNLNKDHEVAVIEMGMNHFNEIHRLSLTAAPQIGVITNIGTSHIENLGSQEGILKAKLEILDGLKEGGLLLVNGDDKFLKEVTSNKYRIIKYGEHKENDYYCSDIYSEGHITYATVNTPKESYQIAIPALGVHMVHNSLVAIAIAEYLGLSKQNILDGLMAYIPSKMRMNITQVQGGITIMDDTYNASPDSMKAALSVLANYQSSGRKVAVLGDMFEMGDFGPKLHQEVGKYVAEEKIDVLYAIGDLAKYIAEGAKEHKSKNLTVKYYADKQNFITDLEHILHKNDTVLLKASRGMQFEEIVKAIGKVNDNEK